MSPSRRSFLGASIPAWAGFSAALQAESPTPTVWRLIRDQFPLQSGLTYLNAANICPSSRLVLDRYIYLLRDFHADPSFQNREKFKGLQEVVRTKLAGMLSAGENEIAITRNTSEGTNIIVEGLDLKAGDEIVITEHNHPSNNDAWKVRARRHGLVIKSVPVSIPPRSKDDLIAGFDQLITPKTKVVSFTHVTSTIGTLYPAKEITQLARRKSGGAWVHLDGAQSFGALKVDLKDIGCDSYSGSAHKWMMGPLEAGVLFVRSPRLKEVWPSIVTAGWSESLVGARKLENLGQRDDARVAAFEAAVDFYNLVGAERIEARVKELAGVLKQGLTRIPGIRLKTSMQPELSGGVVKFIIPNRDTKATYDRLWEKHRISIASTLSGDAEGLRISPHIYNSEADLDRALQAIKEVV